MDIQNVNWPGWEVVRKIGAGSFGAVYEIERNVLNRKEKAALKVISIPEHQEDIEELYNDGMDSVSVTAHFKDFMENVLSEYSLMLDMKGHTNVVYCDDLRYIQHPDGIGWDIYIKMELLTPLKKVIGSEYNEAMVIAVARDMCKALELCKKRNIVHRDIKPENVFVSQDGDYKLGDFGVAKVSEKTAGGTKTGTYEYMAPEVYNNQPYGSGADIYSLGIMLYWLMNERRTPFLPLPPAVATVSVKENARRLRFSGEPIPAPAHGSDALKAIVLKACAFDPKQRYESAAAMLADLKALDDGAVFIPPVVPVSEPDSPSVYAATARIPVEEGTVNVFAASPAAQKTAARPQTAAKPEIGAFFVSSNAEVEQETEDTVGIFGAHKPISAEESTVYEPTMRVKSSQPASDASAQPPRKRKWYIPVIAIALVIAIIILLLTQCGPGQGTPTEPSGEPTGTTAPTDTPTDPTDPTDAPTDPTDPTDAPTNPTDAPTEPPTTDPTAPPATEPTDPPATEPVTATLQSISVASKPTKTTYVVGETLNTAGLKLKLSYSDGTSQTVTSGFTCTPTALNTVGQQTITVTYGGKSTTFTVAVENITVTSIRISSQPSKTTYIVGDSLDTTGLTLLVTYSDGATLTITSGFTCTPTTLSTVGQQTVTVTYGGKTATFTVTVEEDTAEVIAIGTCGDNLTWYLTDDYRLVIQGSGEMYDYYYLDKKWAPWTDYREKIVSVSLPDGLTSIGEYAFYYCEKLSGVLIPGSVTKIGESAFQDCSSIQYATIPDGVTVINERVFYRCTALRNVTIPNSVTTICFAAFAGSEAITSIFIPANVSSIEGGAFTDCPCLTLIELSPYNQCFTLVDGVLYTKDMKTLVVCPGGFSGSLTVPSDVRSILAHAFRGCRLLTEVTLHNNITSIGSHAFSGCYNLKQIAIPKSVTAIEAYTFSHCTSLTSIEVPDSVTTIGSRAFGNCTKLTSVKLPGGLTKVYDYLFYYCTSLTSITIPDSVTCIMANAFTSCSKLESVTIGANVEYIGSSAFARCTSLKEVALPAKTEKVYSEAFAYCSSLTSITVLNASCDINSNARTLGSSSKTTIYGYVGSTAQTYAENFGYTFVAI